MTQDYTLSGLALTFGEHAKMSESHRNFAIEEFKKNFPDQEVPTSLTYDFNISKALSVMAAEIEKIKHCLGIKENN